MNTELIKYKDFYCSTRKDNMKLYFSTDVTCRVERYTYDGKDELNLSVTIDIRYPILINEDNNRIYEDKASMDNWILKSSFSDDVTLSSSVMITTKYRSFGVGTVVLNKILEIGKEYLPDYSLDGFLSPVDADEENFERRERLYDRVGFEINGDKIRIDRLSDLTLKDEFEGITKIKSEDEISRLYYKTLEDSKDNSRLTKTIDYMDKNYNELEKKYFMLMKVFSLFVLVAVFVVTFA